MYKYIFIYVIKSPIHLEIININYHQQCDQLERKINLKWMKMGEMQASMYNLCGNYLCTRAELKRGANIYNKMIQQNKSIIYS